MKSLTLVVLASALSAVSLFAQDNKPRVSPHDTVSVALGTQTITITYGRPYLKGRQVGKEVAPYGEVWRTGADEATTLNTTAAITIGDLQVPAGEYALFTLPTAKGWTLIINKTAKQWGAFKYQESQDLGRTKMKVTKHAPVEQFTIALDKKSDKEAQLVLSWGTTTASTKIKLP